MGVEALRIPHGNAGANEHAADGTLKVKMRDILQIADLAEFYAHRAGLTQLGVSLFGLAI